MDFLQVITIINRVRTNPGNPEKFWNFILPFSRTFQPWKITAGPGKFWKSMNSWKK